MVKNYICWFLHGEENVICKLTKNSLTIGTEKS